MFYTLLIFLTLISSATQLLRCGDLIFVAEDNGEFSRAISLATVNNDSISFVHVGIINIDIDGQIKVIEASPKFGVHEINLEDFLRDSPLIVVKRLKKNFSPQVVVENALKHLNEPYDWWYLPDNGKMYCSELVYESFMDAEGKKIFKSKPISFRDKDGQVPQFWIDLFSKLEVDIPEGVEGTNPNDLAADKNLFTVLTISNQN